MPSEQKYGASQCIVSETTYEQGEMNCFDEEADQNSELGPEPYNDEETDIFTMPSASDFFMVQTVKTGTVKLETSGGTRLSPIHEEHYFLFNAEQGKYLPTEKPHQVGQRTPLIDAVSDEKAVEHIVNTYHRAIQFNDFDSVLSLHTIESQQTIKKEYIENLASATACYRIHRTYVFDCGDTECSADVIIDQKESNSPMETWRLVHSLKKENGTWKISRSSGQKVLAAGHCYLPVEIYEPLKQDFTARIHAIATSEKLLREQYDPDIYDSIYDLSRGRMMTRNAFAQFTYSCKDASVVHALNTVLADMDKLLGFIQSQSNYSAHAKQDLSSQARSIQRLVKKIAPQFDDIRSQQ